MARRRTVRPFPDVNWRAYRGARTARKSVLHVIVKTIQKSKKTGAQKIVIHTGSSFVIKVDFQSQQSFLLTSEHVVRGQLNPGDGVHVRIMVPGGVQEFPADIVHKSRAHDVAILRVPGLTAAPPLRFSPDTFVGEGVMAVGYSDPNKLFKGLAYTKIPAIHPGRVSGIVRLRKHNHIRLYHLVVSCVGMEGMSGGPIISERDVVGMIDSGQVSMHGVHPTTILGLLKQCVGLPQQSNRTMEDVILMLR